MSKFLKAFLFVSLVFAPFAASAVTVASWGGAYTESQQKAYADTYSDPSSIVFENYNGGLGEVRAQVESGSVTWDIVDVLPSDACLLYTSPSPRDMWTSRMPSSA